jgi:HEPN domain-containing protein
MPQPDRAAYVGRWLGLARIDLGTARTLLRDRDETASWVVCFHAQQAAEKYLKAVLTAVGQAPPFGHNLVALQALLPDGFPFPAGVELGLLTTYAVSTRYVLADMPDEPDPTWAEAEAAVGWADSIGRATDAWLTEPQGA